MPAEALHVELLHSCPLRCLACDHRLLGEARLSAASLGKILARPEFGELRLISFSGGEPLLHPELGTIVRNAAAAFPAAAVVVLSSLFETDALKNFINGLPPSVLPRLHLGASLDGPPETHDRMRGRTGAFAALKRSHAWLRSVHPALSVGFTFTATSVNVSGFYGAWLEAERLGAPLGLQFLVPNANTRGLELSSDCRGTLRKGVEAVLERLRADGRDSSAGIRELQSALALLRGERAAFTCGAGRSFFMLSPDGRFYLCPLHKEVTAAPDGLAGLRPRLKGALLKACGGCFLRCARTEV